MAKREKKVIVPHHEIQFLNLPDKGSMAAVGVKIQGDLVGKSSYYDNYEIKITDCDRTVTLHGSLNNPKSRENALKKFDTLIEVLTRGRDHIEKELKEKRLKYKG